VVLTARTTTLKPLSHPLDHRGVTYGPMRKLHAAATAVGAAAMIVANFFAGETEPISTLRATQYRVIAAMVQGSNNNVIVTPGPGRLRLQTFAPLVSVS